MCLGARTVDSLLISLFGDISTWLGRHFKISVLFMGSLTYDGSQFLHFASPANSSFFFSLAEKQNFWPFIYSADIVLLVAKFLTSVPYILVKLLSDSIKKSASRFLASLMNNSMSQFAVNTFQNAANQSSTIMTNGFFYERKKGETDFLRCDQEEEGEKGEKKRDRCIAVAGELTRDAEEERRERESREVDCSLPFFCSQYGDLKVDIGVSGEERMFDKRRWLDLSLQATSKMIFPASKILGAESIINLSAEVNEIITRIVNSGKKIFEADIQGVLTTDGDASLSLLQTNLPSTESEEIPLNQILARMPGEMSLFSPDETQKFLNPLSAETANYVPFLNSLATNTPLLRPSLCLDSTRVTENLNQKSTANIFTKIRANFIDPFLPHFIPTDTNYPCISAFFEGKDRVNIEWSYFVSQRSHYTAIVRILFLKRQILTLFVNNIEINSFSSKFDEIEEFAFHFSLSPGSHLFSLRTNDRGNKESQDNVSSLSGLFSTTTSYSSNSSRTPTFVLESVVVKRKEVYPLSPIPPSYLSLYLPLSYRTMQALVGAQDLTQTQQFSNRLEIAFLKEMAYWRSHQITYTAAQHLLDYVQGKGSFYDWILPYPVAFEILIESFNINFLMNAELNIAAQIANGRIKIQNFSANKIQLGIDILRLLDSVSLEPYYPTNYFLRAEGSQPGPKDKKIDDIKYQNLILGLENENARRHLFPSPVSTIRRRLQISSPAEETAEKTKETETPFTNWREKAEEDLYTENLMKRMRQQQENHQKMTPLPKTLKPLSSSPSIPSSTLSSFVPTPPSGSTLLGQSTSISDAAPMEARRLTQSNLESMCPQFVGKKSVANSLAQSFFDELQKAPSPLKQEEEPRLRGETAILSTLQNIKNFFFHASPWFLRTLTPHERETYNSESIWGDYFLAKVLYQEIKDINLSASARINSSDTNIKISPSTTTPSPPMLRTTVKTWETVQRYLRSKIFRWRRPSRLFLKEVIRSANARSSISVRSQDSQPSQDIVIETRTTVSLVLDSEKLVRRSFETFRAYQFLHKTSPALYLIEAGEHRESQLHFAIVRLDCGVVSVYVVDSVMLSNLKEAVKTYTDVASLVSSFEIVSSAFFDATYEDTSSPEFWFSQGIKFLFSMFQVIRNSNLRFSMELEYQWNQIWNKILDVSTPAHRRDILSFPLLTLEHMKDQKLDLESFGRVPFDKDQFLMLPSYLYPSWAQMLYEQRIQVHKMCGVV